MALLRPFSRCLHGCQHTLHCNEMRLTQFPVVRLMSNNTDLIEALDYVKERKKKFGTGKDNVLRGLIRENNRLIQDRYATVQHLLAKIVHEDENIVALNKPSGLPMSYHPSKPKNVKSRQPLLREEEIVHLEKLLPDLEYALKCKLHITMYLPRMCSGICILAKSAEMKDLYRKRVSTLKSSLQQPYQHWEVTLARSILEVFVTCFKFSNPPTNRPMRHLTIPIDITDLTMNIYGFDANLICFGIPHSIPAEKEKYYLETVKYHDIPQTILVNPSNNEIKKGVVNSSHIYGSVAAKNETKGRNCAHVKLSTTSGMKNFLEAFMAENCAPVIGEHVYTWRVCQGLKKPVGSVPPHTQALPTGILQNLDISEGFVEHLPLFLHRSIVDIVNFPHLKMKKPYQITAPLPKYFTETLNRLDLLTLDNKNIQIATG